MQKLTQKGAKDAEAVKVLTIVALVFLPTTAVLVGILLSLAQGILTDKDRAELLLHVICGFLQSAKRLPTTSDCQQLVGQRSGCCPADHGNIVHLVVLRASCCL